MSSGPTFLLTAIVAVVFTVHGVSCRHLVQLAMLHRHGARTEPFVSDHGLDWDACVLSEAGVEMALSLGRFTKQKYAGFLPDTYDERVISSISTDFERTIRTGVGVLRGMYGNDSNAIPYLAHKPQDKDFLLSFYYSWPSADLGSQYISGYNTRNNVETLSYFPQAQLDVIGHELDCPNLCRENQTLCALLGEDVATCRRSNGGLSPELAALFPLMFEAQEHSNAFLYLYNSSDTYWNATGPYGRLLAVDIINHFNATLQAGSSPQVKLYHYSAHDVTIYSFFTAIGAIEMSTPASEVDILVPNFASATFLELFDDGNISVAFFECNQSKGSGFPYAAIPNVFLGCKLSDDLALGMQDVYHAVECPLEHFNNYVALKAPRVSGSLTAKPWCYADPADVATTNCWPNTTDVPNAICSQYRAICPEFACDGDAGFVLNRSDYRCVSMLPAVEGSAHSHSAGWYFGVVAASFVIGVVIGSVIRFFLYEIRAKSDAAARNEAESLLSPSA